MSLLRRIAPELARNNAFRLLNPWNDSLRELSDPFFDLSKRALAIDVTETPESFIIEAEVPGFKKEDILLQTEGSSLRLKGEYQHDNESKEAGNVFSERIRSSFDRQIQLPTTIDVSKVSASLHSGILKVVVPKGEHSHKASISIE
jgi:HSP20 family protein